MSEIAINNCSHTNVCYEEKKLRFIIVWPFLFELLDQTKRVLVFCKAKQEVQCAMFRRRWIDIRLIFFLSLFSAQIGFRL